MSNKESLELRPWRQGQPVHRKLSYPARCGLYHELLTPAGRYHLGLDGFPKFFQGSRSDWPHPQEWLKITRNADPVYYSTQGYSDVYALTGEYYYPLPAYPTNALYVPDAGQRAAMDRFVSIHREMTGLAAACRNGPYREGRILEMFSAWTWEGMTAFSRRLHRIIQAQVPVLPPDCRHVDYEVLPLVIAEGCQANCGFCRIKSAAEFRLRTPAEIRAQLAGLAALFGDELANYRGVFLGQHDALAAGGAVIEEAVASVLELLDPKERHVRGLEVFLFGSTGSFLDLDDSGLARLQALPCRLFVNIGLESFDQGTLEYLRKPLRADENRAAFARMLAVNRSGGSLSVTANLLLGDPLAPGHLRSLQAVLSSPQHPHPETVVYLSPMLGAYQPASILGTVRMIKNIAKVRTYPYMIHRL